MSGVVLLGLRVLAAMALYVFLGGIMYFLLSSMKKDFQLLESPHIPPIDIVVNIPDREDQVFHFSKSNVAIGRNPDCDCILAHTTVSAHHARLFFHKSQWWVDDLLSTNGTLLNNELLKLPAVIVDGDIIKCGQITLKVLFSPV